MNFTSFGGHFSTTLPAIHQFAAKFSQDSVSTNICSSQENSNKYTDSPDFPQHVTHNTLISGKFHNNFINQAIYTQQVTLRQEKKHTYEAQELAQGLCAAMIQQQEKQTEKQMKEEAQIERRTTDNQQQASHNNQLSSGEPNINISHSATSASWQSLTTTSPTVVDYLSQLPASSIPLSLHHFLKYSADNIKKETVQLNTPALDPNIAGLQCTTANVNNINASTLSNHSSNIPPANSFNRFTSSNTHNNGSGVLKKKKKKKTEEEKKPRPKPGEIRLTTALDGSTLYCCPECHMAYPEKELLEQHLIGHTLERRFVCDICGAGLKRKDHLTRHKQSHNPERPYVCTVCLKAFKRKEQLTLHFVIHSGEKRHLCTECGKGFYRKDHLRKHARSHIARRVKAELSQQGNSYPVLQTQVPAPPLHHNSTGIIL